MRTIKLTIAYDGGAYEGWQSQPSGNTVQQTLERALEKLVGHGVHAIASGRTDAGVHALGQVVSFQTTSAHPAEVFVRALNATLPDDLAVLAAADAPPGFHARRDARRKRYRYLLNDAATPNVFGRRYAWHCWQRLDATAMHESAQALVGTHDFRSFETSGSERASSVRAVSELTVARLAIDALPLAPEPLAAAMGSVGDSSWIAVEIEGNGFLYNMVRTIVGTLVEVGRGARSGGWPADVLAAADRRAAGPTAPAHGLFLVRVDY